MLQYVHGKNAQLLSLSLSLSYNLRKPTKYLLLASRTLTLLLSTFLLTFIVSSLVSIPRLTSAAATPISCSLPHTLSTCLSLTANNVNLTMPPVTNGSSFAYSTNIVNVKTNTPSYTLTLSTNSANETSKSLTHTTTPTTTIAPTTGTIASPSALIPNTWGYTLTTNPTSSSTVWSSIPTNTTPATLVTNGTGSDTTGTNTNINYGVNIDVTKEAGNYTATLVYTAIVTPIPAPTITTVSPSYGPTAGGTTITITGTNFYDTAAVTAGGTNCTSYTVNSPTSITCTTPAGTAGAKNVTVTSENGTVTETDAFTYGDLTPTITTPTTGTKLAAGTTSTTLIATTDIPAICYYGTSSTPYTQMTTTGNTTLHTANITYLTNASTNTRYVRCRSAVGQTDYGPTTSTTFYIKAATPALPTLTPANNATAPNSTTTIRVTSSGSTCTWGTTSTTTTNASGATRTSTTGANVLYYSCTAGSGDTISDTLTGSWSYTGIVPACPILTSKTYLQDIQTPTAPPYGTDRQRVVLKDRRNNQDYYVQNIVNQDGSCLAWMETNLRYAGDGNWDSSWGYPDDRYATSISNSTGNTNDDSRPLSTTSSGYLGGSQATQYTMAGYFDPGGSTDYTNTTVTSGFFGYFYNWCAAMGGQANACNDTSTTGFDTTISICPSGWRLPTGSYSGEFQKLYIAVNPNPVSHPGGLFDDFLAVLAGYYRDRHQHRWDGMGYYWSSTIYSATEVYEIYLTEYALATGSTAGSKSYGYSVRCVLG